MNNAWLFTYRCLFLKDKDQLIRKIIKLTSLIGVDMLLQYINGAQTNHKAPAKPERDHRPISLMQINQELVQTSTVHNIWKITIPEKRATSDKITGKNKKFNLEELEKLQSILS